MPTTGITVILVVLAIAVFAFAFTALRIHGARQRAWRVLDEGGIRRALEVVLLRGYDGAVGILTDRATGRFVQFRKYISEPDRVGLEMHFPRAPWSETYYPDVQATLHSHGVPFQRVALNAGSTVEVLHADFHDDLGRATAVTGEIFGSVFRISPLCVELEASDICPLNVRVDRLDYPRPFDIATRRRRPPGPVAPRP